MVNLLREGATSHPLEFEVGDQGVRHSRGALARLPQGEGDKGKRFGGSFGGLQEVLISVRLQRQSLARPRREIFHRGDGKGCVSMSTFSSASTGWQDGLFFPPPFSVFFQHTVLISPARH